MSRFLASVFFFVASVVCGLAVEDPRLSAVMAADDARIAAMLSPSQESLSQVLSDDLRYAHSNGILDTKKSLVESLLQKKLQYFGLDYEERNFSFPAPEVALMSGKVRLKVKTASGEVEALLMYLAVWKLEGGKWRFLAWQACKLSSPTSK